MSLKKKILAAGLAVCMAAIMVTGMTLAYFTDTATKKNVFTVGKVEITLTEPNWDAEANSNKDLIPGKDIPKDPTITLTKDSEMAYTFMKVELSQDFVDLMTAYATAKGIENPADVIEAWFTTSTHPKIMAMDLTERYVILGVLSPKNPGESVTYFDEVNVPTDVTQEMITEAGSDYTITVTAYAIQAEGFYDAAEDDTEEEKQASRTEAFKALFPGETIIP